MPHLNEVKKKLLTEGILGQYVHGESTIAHTDCVLIDVFSPLREDYKE